MQNPFQIFKSSEFGIIRVAGTPENPRFCLADVCRALELGNPSQVKTRLSDGVISNEVIVDSLGRQQNATFVNEDGLYDVILESRKPEARRFRKWITCEVIPQIRRTGYYSLANAQAAVAVQNKQRTLYKILEDIKKSAAMMVEMCGVKPEIALAKAISIAEKFYGVDLSEVKLLLPAAEHEIGYMNATEVGKNFGISARVVNQILVEEGLQKKVEKSYTLTDEGKKYGEAMPFNNNTSGHSGYQIKWSAAVFSFFEKHGYTLK